MKKQILFLLGTLLLSSCGNNGTSSPTSIVVTDSVGREVLVDPGTYHKVVCIGAGALRLYSYVADRNLLAGVEDIDNESLSTRPAMFDGVARPYFIANKDFYKTLPSCGVGGPMAQMAEEEKILSCNPDIVFSEYEDADKATALQQKLGVPVVTLGYGPKGVFDSKVKSSINLIGKVMGLEDKSKTLIQFIDAQTSEISSRTASILNKPNVYICGLGNWGVTTHLSTAQNYEPFNVANVNNVVTDLVKDGIQEIDAEKFASLSSSMDIMIMDSASMKKLRPLSSEYRTALEGTKAWQNGEVYLEMAFNAYYTNLEIALANTWFIAKSVYPSLFLDVDMDTKLSEITTAFLGVDLTSAIKSYPMSFGGYQKIDVSTFFG